MQSFDYQKPSTLDQAVASLDGDAKALAGGQTLLPAMKVRLAGPGTLVDLGGLPELKEIAADGGVLTIGAGETHAAVAQSDIVVGAIPALAALAGGIGDPAVRHRGTLGGSVANNDPAADYPSAMLALGATIHTNSRAIAADDFFTGMFETALGEDELIVKISIPVPDSAGYAKYPNPASRYAMVGVFVAKFGPTASVAVTGAGQDGVFRAADLEAALTADFSEAAVSDGCCGDVVILGDIHASADYRRAMIPVFARKAVAKATE